MTVWDILLVGLVGWTAIGLGGVTISAVRGERKKALHGVLWLVGIWVVYLAAVMGVSLAQKQRMVAVGQDQCFDEMCFAVTKVEEVPGFSAPNQRRDHPAAEGQERMVRVSVRISNHAKGKAESEALISAYLVDDRGRRWEPVAGLSGVKLTTRVSAGDTVMSEPVFRVGADARGLELVFTHGRWQPGSLVIGDSDSLLHRRTGVKLGI